MKEFTSDKELEEFILAQEDDKPTFVQFYGDWCGPSKHSEAVFTELNLENSNRASFVRIESKFFGSYSEIVQIVPTIILYLNKYEKDKVVGSNDDEIRKFVTDAINSM